MPGQFITVNTKKEGNDDFTTMMKVCLAVGEAVANGTAYPRILVYSGSVDEFKRRYIIQESIDAITIRGYVVAWDNDLNCLVGVKCANHIGKAGKIGAAKSSVAKQWYCEVLHCVGQVKAFTCSGNYYKSMSNKRRDLLNRLRGFLQQI